jgi:hypothetical protein
MKRFTRFQEDPCRSPAWRWVLANWLFASRTGRMSRWDDPWIRRAVFHLRSEDGQDPWTRRNARTDPAVAEAIRIVRCEKSLQSLRIEAGVLARRTAREIAADEDLQVETVEAYEALHFDVRSKLHASSYIRWMVIGRDSRTGEIASWPAFVRQMAFDGGPLVLNAAFKSALPVPEGVRADPLRLQLRCLWLATITPASAHSPIFWKDLERLASITLGATTTNLAIDPAAQLAALVARSFDENRGIETEITHENRQVG